MTQNNDDPTPKSEIFNAYKWYIKEAKELKSGINDDIKASFKYTAYGIARNKYYDDPRAYYDGPSDIKLFPEGSKNPYAQFTIIHEAENIEMTKIVWDSQPPSGLEGPSHKKWKKVDSKLIHDICFTQFKWDCCLTGSDQIFIQNIVIKIMAHVKPKPIDSI